ncbi:hypothetical protein [Streptomyces capoamus]|uniref:hypothetical protein n=1 Tax=Streptomyces capoamus TaxID=68183 RepID=UPI00339669FD
MRRARCQGIRTSRASCGKWLQPGDLLVQDEFGGTLASSVIRRAWRSARKAVLPPHVFESPTGRRVYDNRNTRLTKWLNDGIPPAQVAEWAGISVAVLPATYARCIDGQLPDLKRRLEDFDTYSTRPPAKTR